MEEHRKDTCQEAAIDNSRRKALKKILIGGGAAVGATMLPGRWMKPVIDAGLLPPSVSVRLVRSVPVPYCFDRHHDRR